MSKLSNVKRPLLRYFGGKWQLRHWIIEHLPEHEFYAEPFAGAASVLLGKKPASKGEIINDLNQDVINLFRVMQGLESSQELIRRLEWTPYAYSELVSSKDPSDDPIEKARKMLVLSFMGINVAGTKGTKSGFRMGNVDLGRLDLAGKRTFRNCARDWRNWKLQVEMIRERLSEVMIYERDAFDFIELMDNEDCLLYVDPPYHQDTRSAGSRYVVDFVDQQHIDLVSRLIQCRSKVVLSGYDCPAYEPFDSAGWVKETKVSRANMSLNKRVECLWISPNCFGL